MSFLVKVKFLSDKEKSRGRDRRSVRSARTMDFPKTSPGGISPTAEKSGKPVARVSWNVRSLASGGCKKRNCHTAVQGEVPAETDNNRMMSIYVYHLCACV